MITKAEISKVLNDKFNKASEEHLVEIEGGWKLNESEFVGELEYIRDENIGDLHFSFVTQEGGEDQGSNYFFIHKVSRGNDSVLVKFTGHYNSYDGTEYYNQLNDFKFVEPAEKITIVYKEVK